tara:strand:+ start:1503 stop:4577 length:3075 start_codon:yes stop_codon:yes gene_type:complete
MKIPIKILLSDILDPTGALTWGDVIDNWQTYSQEWQSSNGLGVVQDEAPVLDMFGDESLTIKQMVKDLNDPSKLFTSLSRSFNLPASKKNNKIFKHYYNIDIVNGLDSRELIPCKLLLNNVTYNVGNLSIEGVKMSGGKPMSYRVRYIGKLSELSRKIGQDKLSNLDFLSETITSFNPANEFGSNTTGNVVFPLASRSNRMLYDSTTKDINTEGAKNIAYIDGTSISNNKYGIAQQDLVPALKVGVILDKIASTYGISFSGAFSQDYVRELYLWLHRTDKERTGDKNSAIATPFSNVSIPDFEIMQVRTDNLFFSQSAVAQNQGTVITEVRITPTFTGNADVHIKFNGVIVQTVSVSGGTSGIYSVNTHGIVTFEAESSQSVTVNLDIQLQQYGSNINNTRIGSMDSVINIGSSGTFKVADNVPNMKVIDFLSSLFKMFNIVAEVSDALDIEGTHFDAFMNRGVLRDVSEYVDIDDYNVDRPNLFSAMRFKFAEPKTAMELGYEKVNGKNYGELEYELTGQTGVKLAGNEYSLDLKNQRIPLEPLTDLADGSNSGVIYTQFADLKGAEQHISPMFTYLAKVTSGAPLSFDDGGSVSQIVNYIMASNIHTDNAVQPLNNRLGDVGLYFGEELNEYNYTDSLSGLGLFSNFYKGLTAMMFDEDKRSVVFKSHIPTSIIGKMSLSDTLTINNSFYNINSIDTNYLSGESKLDLTLVGKSQLKYFVKSCKSITNNSSSDVLRITYLNEFGFIESASISVSNALSIEVIGDVITFSHSEYTYVKCADLDTVAPDAPIVTYTNVTCEGLTINWTEPYDNVGIASYTVYNGATAIAYFGNTVFSANIGNLRCTTSFSGSVSATDSEGNESTHPIVIETIPTCSLTAPTGLNVSNITETSMQLNYDASPDADVSTYRITKDGVFVSDIGTLSVSLSSLTAGTSYTLGVSYIDSCGTISSESTISATTDTTSTSGISYTLQNGTNSDLTFSYTNTSGGVATGLLGPFEGDTICAEANTVSADTGISISTGGAC